MLVKIWNKEGRIIYSNNKKLKGKKFPIEEDLKEVLEEGETTKEISNLRAGENIEEKKLYSYLVEVYTPIYSRTIPKKIVGAYEIYQDPKSLEKHVGEVRKFLWIGILVGFSLLYLFLFGIVRQGSHALVAKKELEELTTKLKSTLSELEETSLGAIKSLSATVDAKDHYTAGHSLRVSLFAKELGVLAGLSKEDLNRLEQAAIFHDIGKIGLAEEVLNKEGALTPAELKEVKKHSSRGAEIIETIPFLKDKVALIRHHHENFDGTGYPDGLKGEKIPLGARILRIADAYDALTSQRSYRYSKSPEEALRLLREGKGKEFDPQLIDLFKKWLGERGVVIKKRHTVLTLTSS